VLTPATNGSRIIGFYVAGLLAVTAGLTPDPAAADTNDSDTLQEVVVTATKLNAQSVLDVPVSVQALSADFLQRQLASGIMSIAADVPGLSRP
jgi:Flp pilus assembly protein CpaB